MAGAGYLPITGQRLPLLSPLTAFSFSDPYLPWVSSVQVVASFRAGKNVPPPNTVSTA
jgi:hypothetical protein